jgi:hypothetical protein
MKKIESTYEHRGALFTCTDAAIADAADHLGIDLLRHVETAIDSMLQRVAQNAKVMGAFRVSALIEKETTPDDEIVHRVRVFKVVY